jgi:polysaccharide biosynthesis transport protein
MSLFQFLLILRARRRIIVYTVLSAIAVALLLSLLLPKTYKAIATVVVNSKGVDPVSGFALPAQLLPGYMATQVDIITSKSVALKVVDDLKLAQQAKFQQKFAQENNGSGTIRDWLAERLLKKLDVAPARESNVADISFKGDTPEFAAAVANAFANAYQQTNLQLKVGPMKTASTYFNDQIKALRDKLEAAQARMSAYQKEKGISSTDNRIDMETIRLNELTSQLVTVQGELMDASSRQRGAQGAGAAEAPDVLADPLIQNLKAALVQAQARMSEVAQRFTPEHPRYEEAKAEVDKRRAELNRSIRAASNGVSNRMRILQQREAELQTALAAQKAKVLDFNRARDELAVLGKEVESAQRAYDTATQRFSQTSLEGQSQLSEVAVLSPALPPFKKSSPKLSLNLLLAVAVGSVLGMGLALLAEVADRQVRSVSDLAEVLQAPVMGVFSWPAKAPRRTRLPRWLAPQRLLADQRGWLR